MLAILHAVQAEDLGVEYCGCLQTAQIANAAKAIASAERSHAHGRLEKWIASVAQADEQRPAEKPDSRDYPAKNPGQQSEKVAQLVLT
jgi:hypothetical protein